MPVWTKADDLIRDSDVSQYQGKNPSEIEKDISAYNAGVITINDLYDETEAVSSKIKISDIDSILTAIRNNQNLATDDEKKKNNLIKSFVDYQNDMKAIDKRGRTKSSRFKFAMTHWVQNTRELYVRELKNYKIGEAYTESGNDVTAKLTTFKECLKDSNKVKLLILINALNKNTEKLKQLRDFKIAQKKGKIDGRLTQDQAEHIYSYGDHQEFKTSADVRAITDEQAKADSHLKHIKKEQELEEKFDNSGVAKVLNDQIILSYLTFDPDKYSADLASAANTSINEAKRTSDIRGKLSAAPAGVPVQNINDLYDAQLKLYEDSEITEESGFIDDMIKSFLSENAGDISGWIDTALEFLTTTALPKLQEWGALKGSPLENFFNNFNINGELFDVMGAPKKDEEIKKISDNLKKGERSLVMNDEQAKKFGETKLNRKNGEDLVVGQKKDSDGNVSDVTISQKDLSDQYYMSGSLGFLNALAGTIGAAFQWKDISDMKDDIADLEDKGAIADASLKKFERVCDIISAIMATVDTASAFSKASVDMATAAGAVALQGASTAATAFEHIGGVTAIISGAASIAKGSKQISKASGAKKAANTSLSTVDNIAVTEEQEAKKQQAKRFLTRVAISENQNLATAALDTATGVLNTASGITAFIPGANIVGTALGIAASAASFVGKMIISKIFKDKRVDAAWESLLGFANHSAYKEFLKDMGGKADQRFHNVMRRKTGIATRTDYAESLAVTDAIDLFAAAKAYQIINPNLIPTSSEQQIIKEQLKGMQFIDSRKYDKITLSDILNKEKASADWKGTLKKAITNNAQFNFKEDVSAGEAERIKSGAYD